jgi:hypothetical protein
MIDNIILEAVRDFLVQNVSPKIKLQVPYDDDITKYRLMHPNVFIGWLPPPNALDDAQFDVDGIKKAIPAMVIGMDEGEDDGNDADIDVRITFITYNPGLYAPAEEDPEEIVFTPNFQGYRDLLNLIFICRQQLSSAVRIGDGRTSINKPFRWGMYQQQPVGYWAGWLTFRATAVTLPYMGIPGSLFEIG